MIIGGDIGTDGTKTSEGIVFKSKITEYDQFTDDNKVIYNGKKIYVGVGEFTTDWDKSNRENTLPLLYTAIARSTTDNINSVVLGLPIQQYKKHKDYLIELIKNNNYANVNGRDLIIDKVDVVPESASAFNNIPNDVKSKVLKSKLVIVDIGGRTTDICEMKSGKIVQVKTIPGGMLNVYEEIIDYINRKFTEEFKLEDAEDILKNGLILNGMNINVSFIQGILKNYFNSIYKDLQLKFNLNQGYVFLTGGGSLVFRRAFENRLNNLIISDNPIFDNAIGNKRYGESIWLNR